MNVRICGPNLYDQSKGDFHVHADGCGDLKHYGPGRRFGGDADGARETLVVDATVRGCVLAVYDNGILDEAVAEYPYGHDGQTVTKEELADSPMYAGDFWFAPCCGKLADH
jgi:hypothetical protein